MRPNLFVCVSIVVSAIAPVTSAQNQITSWGEGTAGTHFNIVDALGTIVILRGDGLNYKFYALDPTAPLQNGLGIINNITIDAGATGDFTLLIDHPTGGQRGAFRWSAGDLRYPGGTCTIVGIDVAQALIPFDPDGPADVRPTRRAA